MKTRFGRQEAQMLAYLQMRRKSTVRTGELTGPLGLTREQERELFRRLSRARVIARVRRGLYLVPPQLPLGGSWSPGEAPALNALMEDRQGRWQICGPNAFARYGLDEQVPTRLYVYNNRTSGERNVGALSFTLIKVADARLGDTEEIRTPTGLPMIYSSRPRTLVDAVYDWARFDGLPRGYGWIRRELAARRVSPADLVDATLRYGDKATIRRIGVLLERQGATTSLLGRLERALRPTTSTIPWIPTLPKRGTANRRWGVTINGQA